MQTMELSPCIDDPRQDERPSRFETADCALVFPAPNPTGELHLGHALNIMTHDTLFRWWGLKGRRGAWRAALDHGGISTYGVVQRRTGVLGKVGEQPAPADMAAWLETISGRIYEQMRSFGVSADMSGAHSIADARHERVIGELFTDLHRAGVIYRAQEISNWCPACRTAVGDMELEPRAEFDDFHTLKYVDADEGSRSLPVSTKVLESLIGDVAVADHPEDRRY